MNEFEELARLLPEGENGPLVVLCAELTVYWRGSMHDHADALLALYRRFLAAEGTRLKYFETGTMAGAKPLKKDTLDMIPFWLRPGKRKKDIFALRLDTASSKHATSDCNFYFNADEEQPEPMGAVRVSLPISALVDDPNAFVGSVAAYVGDFEFESGHAGFGLNWDPQGDEAAKASLAMAHIAAKFHGVDLQDVAMTMATRARTKQTGIKCASWLTLIGNSLLSAMPREPSALAAELAPKCTVHTLANGVMVQAGPAPSLLNRNRGADVSAYQAVGGLVAPHRFTDHIRLFPNLVSTDGEAEGTRRWLARFDP